jgi:SWI/SNF-related matrix-associated actin-dependent regulator of chromatin subfamily A3
MSSFRKHIAGPFSEDVGAAKARLVRLLDTVCLRQTQDRLYLPKAVHILRKVDLSPQERQQYDRTLDTMAHALRHDYSSLHGKHPPGAFQIQLQLRLLCNHGTYQPQLTGTNDRDELSEIEDALLSLGSRGMIRCSSCKKPVSNLARQPSALCQHVLCDECEDQISQQPTRFSIAGMECLPCSTIAAATGPERHAAGMIQASRGQCFNANGNSSKIAALFKDMVKDISSTKRYVFSQRPFTKPDEYCYQQHCLLLLDKNARLDRPATTSIIDSV